MLHHSSKHHPNSLSHFLALHHTNVASPMNSANGINLANDLDATHATHLGSINSNIGKSFTIAAILGLKKSTTAMDNQHGHKDFAVMNLSMAGGGNGNNIDLAAGQNPQHQLESLKPSLMENLGNNSRLPLPFGSHLSQAHLHPPHHSHPGSALESLQQQFQQQHQQHHHHNNVQFHGKERSKGANGENISKSKASLKSKRVRTIFTPEQLERLEAEFERQQYMVGPERLYLAHTLQLTEAQVKVWFQNRRIKWRKHHLEITQQRLALMRHRQMPPLPGGQEEQGGAINELGNNNLAASQTGLQEQELSVCDDSMDSASIGDAEDN